VCARAKTARKILASMSVVRIGLRNFGALGRNAGQMLLPKVHPVSFRQPRTDTSLPASTGQGRKLTLALQPAFSFALGGGTESSTMDEELERRCLELLKQAKAATGIKRALLLDEVERLRRENRDGPPNDRASPVIQPSS
jgi:hypothetical protein